MKSRSWFSIFSFLTSVIFILGCSGNKPASEGDGTGKDSLSEAIHAASERAGKDSITTANEMAKSLAFSLPSDFKFSDLEKRGIKLMFISADENFQPASQEQLDKKWKEIFVKSSFPDELILYLYPDHSFEGEWQGEADMNGNQKGYYHGTYQIIEVLDNRLRLAISGSKNETNSSEGYEEKGWRSIGNPMLELSISKAHIFFKWELIYGRVPVFVKHIDDLKYKMSNGLANSLGVDPQQLPNAYKYANGDFSFLKTLRKGADTQCLCKPYEYVVLSFSSGKKLASLCASADFSAESGQLTYRQGMIGNIDVEFSDDVSNSLVHFTFSDSQSWNMDENVGMKEGGSSCHLEFTKDDALYDLFQLTDAGVGKVGVTIKNAKHESTFSGDGSVTGSLWALENVRFYK